MAVIAINQQHGSRGLELGRLTADLLGYRFLTTDDLVAEAARRYSASPDQLKIADERLPNFWARLTTDLERVIAYFRAVALSEMARDRLVVVGRWVALIVPPQAGAVRVRTAGTFADRVGQVAREEKLDRATAERRVREHDREVHARVQHLYGADIDDASLYTIVLNTGSMPLEALARVLASCAEQADRQRLEGGDRIRDEAIAAQIRAALLAHPKIGNAQVHVACSRGAVKVSGSCLVAPWDELVEQLARQVEGVASVEVAAEEPPIPPRPV
jgi:CMP/dCMP kinase